MTDSILIAVNLLLLTFGLSFVVLGSHALRNRLGISLFYGVMGAFTAVMSWITDMGISVEFSGLTFMVGSTAFYTNLLLGVFVLYVFNGPHAARLCIIIVAGISALTPLLNASLHPLLAEGLQEAAYAVPQPSLRINVASVITTITNMVFLAVAWEFLGKVKYQVRMSMRAFLTFLGVMWLDVLLFTSLAFSGTPQYIYIIQANLLTRLIVACIAFPILYLYLNWQNRKVGIPEQRPVLSILKESTLIHKQLTRAEQEIARRMATEKENAALIRKLQETLKAMKTLRGCLTTCAKCHQVRDEKGNWLRLDSYIQERSETQFSHGLCPGCARELYPDLIEEDDFAPPNRESESHLP